jgi:hypothetical protein
MPTTTYNTGIPHIPYDNVSAIVALHRTCNPIKCEMTHVNIPEFVTSYHLGRNQIRATSIPAKLLIDIYI